MKKLSIVFIILIAAACSSIKISYDFDKTADFSKFKTYSYAAEALKLPIQELNRTRVLEAVDREMTSRGFSKSDSPDVWVDLMVKAERREEAYATTTGTGGMYGYGRAYGYGGGFSTTQINVNQYIDGTLFINIVADNKLVWQGRGTATIDEQASPEKREKNINYAVKQIFTKYPVQPKAKK